MNPRDKLIEFCRHQYFSAEISKFAISRNADIDCVLTHNF